MLPLIFSQKGFWNVVLLPRDSLSSQKRETLRGADSAYYQVGQTGKEGTENQGIEPQGVLKETKCACFRLQFTYFSWLCSLQL